MLLSLIIHDIILPEMRQTSAKKSESFDIPDKFAFLRLTYPHLLRIFVAILSAIKMITFVAPISQRFTRFVQVFLPYFCYLSILSNAQQSLL